MLSHLQDNSETIVYMLKIGQILITMLHSVVGGCVSSKAHSSLSRFGCVEWISTGILWSSSAEKALMQSNFYSFMPLSVLPSSSVYFLPFCHSAFSASFPTHLGLSLPPLRHTFLHNVFLKPGLILLFLCRFC